MPEVKPVALTSLLIDAENPRLPQPNVGQRDAQRAIAHYQGKKLLVLARDILKHGLNPTDLPIVMPFGDDRDRFVVLEGNRRLAALKALENPETLIDAFDDSSLLSELRKLSGEYQDRPIDKISAVVVASREEADHWIELRHTGQNEGAGVVPWGSDEMTRYRARSSALPIQSQALDLLEDLGLLTPDERRDVPATSLKRLLGTAEVRAKLGLEVRGGKLHLLASRAAVGKALHWLVEQLISGDTKTGDIYNKKTRLKWLKKFPQGIAVAPTVEAGHGTPAKAGKTAEKSRRAPARQKHARDRDYLIPADCVIRVTDKRTSYIEEELRSLSLDSFTNAASVLFRVFLELTVDFYVGRNNLAIGPGSKLRDKLNEVTNHLVSKKKLSDQQARPVRRAAQKDSFLAPSIDLLHQYVHNSAVFPAPGDLRAHWDSLQPFVVAIWAP